VIRDCTVLAVEGTQAAGKTTLVHALVAHYRERGVHVTCTEEPARVSPFIEDIVLRDRPAGAADGPAGFDLVAELDLYAAQLSTQLRAARHHHLLITDKTIMNVTAYARLVLDTTDPRIAGVLDALDQLAGRWAPVCYDAVIYAADRFAQDRGGDAYRRKVIDLQDQVDHAVRRACAAAGARLLDLPTGLDTPARVAWVDQHVRQLGLPHVA
jgi:predicted ATPase